MGLFTLGKKKSRSVAIIDIGSASVGGAYVHYVEGEQPVIYYTARVDIELRDGEEIRDSMLRSLTFLEQLMIVEGAPALRREAGTGAVEEILVSIAAPWQQTVVTNTHIPQRKEFTFTHAHLDAAIKTAASPSKDRIISGHTVIATILNGYETLNPFGKRATRAEIIMLASTLEKEAAQAIEASLRKAFHTGNIVLTAFAPVAYTVFRDLYPHQKDFIILDVSGSGTDVAFVKRGFLMNVHSLGTGTHELMQLASCAGKRAHESGSDLLDPQANATFAKETESIEAVLLGGLKSALVEFSAEQALPRSVFLLSDPGCREYLKRTLEESDLGALWLSSDPLSVIPVLPSHLAPFVKTRGLGDGDLFLAMLALYVARTKGTEHVAN